MNEVKQDKRYFTKDLATAAYLRTQGIDLDIETYQSKHGVRGKFFYDKKYQPRVDEFFRGEGLFLNFSMNLRSLKSEIHNKRGGE